MAEWDPDMTGLIREFKGLKIPRRPFELRPGTSILLSDLFHIAMSGDIARGPDGQRARTGNLRKDLEDYLRVRRTWVE